MSSSTDSTATQESAPPSSSTPSSSLANIDHWDCQNCYIPLNRSALKLCGKCKTSGAARPTAYCSSECAKSDWPAHKKRCEGVVGPTAKRTVAPGNEPSWDELHGFAMLHVQAVNMALVQALGLHDKSQRPRAEFETVVLHFDYQPEEADLKHRFGFDQSELLTFVEMSEVHPSLATIPKVRLELLKQLEDGGQLESGCFVFAHLVCDSIIVQWPLAPDTEFLDAVGDDHERWEARFRKSVSI